MNHIQQKSSPRPIGSGGTGPGIGSTDPAANREWQLADLVDAVAAEVDRAEDTLSLKSYARGITFALKQLSLELEVKVRRDSAGRILFRTTNADETSATVLKLDLAQMLQSQLHGIRKPLDGEQGRDLATLPDITPEEITFLHGIAIYSVDDLERYTQTAAMVAEVSRKSGVADAKLRRWLHLPYITELKPPAGPPGSPVLIEGGNFGAAAPADVNLVWQGQPLTILSWSDSRITVQMPATARGGGVLFAIMNAQTTNAVSWDAAAVDLVVQDILLPATQIFAGEPISLKAVLTNKGLTASAQSFDVQWLIDDASVAMLPHGLLQPGQTSQESSTSYTVSLPIGQHQVRFIADPDNIHPDLNRANGSFVRSLAVEARRELRFGDARLSQLDVFDPLRSKVGAISDFFGLVFRGLVRYQTGGGVELDLSSNWFFDNQRADGNLGVIFELNRPNLTFHDGRLLTADDVAFTYAQLQESPVWGALLKESIRQVLPEGNRVTFVLTGRSFSPKLLPLFTVGIVSKASYETGMGRPDAPLAGCGPFKLNSFDGKQLVLDAFEAYYLGKPRVHRIRMDGGTPTRLIEQLVAGKVVAATLPFSAELARQLASVPNVKVTPVPEAQPALLYAQSTRLRERLPNPYDITTTAHLWYLGDEERGLAKPVTRTQKPRRGQTRRK